MSSKQSGHGGAPVLKLMTPFGGGKSHTMAALFHAATNFPALKAVPEAAGFPNPGEVHVAVVDGQRADRQRQDDGKRRERDTDALGVSDTQR